MGRKSLLKKYAGAKILIAWLVLAIITVISFATLILVKIGNILPPWTSHLPIEAFGTTCLATLIISFVYEYWIREETTKELQNNLFTNNVVAEILSEDRVFAILKSALQRILNDDKYGEDVYNIITNKRVISDERRYNASTSVTLIPSRSTNEDVRIHFYDLIIDYSYEAKVRPGPYVFKCFCDIGEYNKSYEQYDMEWRWLISTPMRLFPLFDATFYKLVLFKLNDQELPINVVADQFGNVEYRAHIHAATTLNATDTISYRIELKQLRFSHGLFVEIREPTLRPTILFDFSKTDISYVSLHTLFTSPGRPTINYYPTKEAFHRIEVSLNDWAIPKSGIGFTWQLRLENDLEIRKKCLSHI